MDRTKAFYSPTEVARLLGLSSDTIINYIKAGTVFAIKLSERTYRIPRREVSRLTGEPVAPSTGVERGRGGAEAAERIRGRLRRQERAPVTR